MTEKLEQYAYGISQTVAEQPGDDVGEIPDDPLRLIFTCCHPALAPESQVAKDASHDKDARLRASSATPPLSLFSLSPQDHRMIERRRSFAFHEFLPK